ncbi:uncharacterized protein LOC143051743 isoform X2 [Mytilus galloprovincialis]|uniref:uncharacterized protein LOC143051743 isoform X2 n=1 Tax=Mytilus galloprovincialis TaxID=29158 RepID=UPI003F7CD1EB
MYRDEKYKDFKARLGDDRDAQSRYDLSSYRLRTNENERDLVEAVQTELSSQRIVTDANVFAPVQTEVIEADRNQGERNFRSMSSYRLLRDENSSDSVLKGQTTEVNDNQIKGEAIFYGQRESDDIRLVLLGRTGSGKSATGNTILTKKEFLSKASGSSITEQCQIAVNRKAGRRYFVVDTPGLFDTKLAHGEITQEIIRCIHMSTPGPHAFLLVLRLDRFTQEEIDTFTCLFELFGEKMSSYAVIVFTRLDDLEDENTNIEEFINNSNQSLKHFINKVEGRYVAFNNRGTEEQKNRQVSNLNETLVNMIQKNGGNHYTNKMYEEAEAHLRQKIQEVERLKALEKQKEIEKIESKFKGTMSALKSNNNMLEKDLRKQKEANANIQSEKEKSQAIIQGMHHEMMRLNENHEKELFEAKKEAKRIEEIKMRELQIKEEENKRQIQAMDAKYAETEKRMQMLETQRQTAVHEQQYNFQTSMEQSVKAIVQETQSAQMKNFQDMLTESKKQTQMFRDQHKDLMKSLDESKQMAQQEKERNQQYMEHMTSVTEQLQSDLRNEERQRAQLEKQFREKSCSIS